MSLALRSVSYVPSSTNAFLTVLTCTPIFAIRGSSLSVQRVFTSARVEARRPHPYVTPGRSPAPARWRSGPRTRRRAGAAVVHRVDEVQELAAVPPPDVRGVARLRHLRDRARRG